MEFSAFRSWALDSCASDMLAKVNRPIVPRPRGKGTSMDAAARTAHDSTLQPFSEMEHYKHADELPPEIMADSYDSWSACASNI